MAESMADNRRSIAQVNRMARSLIEAETLEQYFWLGGTVEGFRKSDRGHIYFRLEDEGKSIRCALFEPLVGNVPFDISNGMSIEVYGDLQFYEAWGYIEIKVLRARMAKGLVAPRPVIQQLRKDGLYPKPKRQPPATIRRIGIITSRSSRAIGDFENAYRTAADGAVLPPYDFRYALVEGKRAPDQVSAAVKALCEDSDYDIIVIIRGGSLTESLAIFDDIKILRAMLRCDKFIITGIGHHSDRTLADDMADYSSATPTAVAHYIASLRQQLEPGEPATLPVQAMAPAATADGMSTRMKIALIAAALAALSLLLIVVVSQLPPG